MKTAEGGFLKDDVSNYDSKEYQDPSVTVDFAVCSIIDFDLKVLLINRKYPPFKNYWAIPGGFVNVKNKESLEITAARELNEETGIKDIYLEQLKAYGDPDRDPRKRIITIVYFALIPFNELSLQKIKADDDAKETQWFSLRNLSENLAFDHSKILYDLLNTIMIKILNSHIAFQLLSKEFTWSELQKVYEIILGKKLIASNFRRKIKSLYVIKELSKMKKNTGRPAKLLTFIKQKEL